MVFDNWRDKVNPSATKLLLGHQSESVAGRWYASADDEEVLNLVSEYNQPGDCAVTMIGNSSKLQRIGNSCTMNL